MNPPLVATEQVVRSDMALFAGGVTWVDKDYDERLGAALRPIEIKGDMRTGFQLRQDVREMLAKAFPGFVAFAAETGKWTISFSSAEIVTGALMGLGVIWSVFNRWGVGR